MAPCAQAATQFNVFDETSFTSGCESDQSAIGNGGNEFTPLRSISVCNVQNYQSAPSTSGLAVDSLVSELKKLHIGEVHEIDQFKGKPVPNSKAKLQLGSRSKRPQLTHNVLRVPETVPEDDHRDDFSATFAADGVSDHDQHYIQVPGEIATD
jgi:hypothetical protein